MVDDLAMGGGWLIDGWWMAQKWASQQHDVVWMFLDQVSRVELLVDSMTDGSGNSGHGNVGRWKGLTAMDGNSNDDGSQQLNSNGCLDGNGISMINQVNRLCAWYCTQHLVYTGKYCQIILLAELAAHWHVFQWKLDKNYTSSSCIQFL